MIDRLAMLDRFFNFDFLISFLLLLFVSTSSQTLWRTRFLPFLLSFSFLFWMKVFLTFGTDITWRRWWILWFWFFCLFFYCGILLVGSIIFLSFLYILLLFKNTSIESDLQWDDVSCEFIFMIILLMEFTVHMSKVLFIMLLADRTK